MTNKYQPMIQDPENMETTKNINRWDTLTMGFLLGGIAPVLALVVYYYAKIHPNSWADFFKYLGSEKRLLSSLTVICLLPNIALFTVFVNTRRDRLAKGVFGITLLFAIVSLLVKFLG